MTEQNDCGANALQRIHILGHPPLLWVPGWQGECNKKLVGGLIAIALAVAIHAWCCDWRLPRFEYSPTVRTYEHVPYGNQVLGMVHASSAFRTSDQYGTSYYNLQQAAVWGILLPLILGLSGTVLVLSQATPDPWKKAIRQRMAGALARNSSVLAAAGAVGVLLMGAGGTAVVGATAVYLSQAPAAQSVAPGDDSFVVDLKAAESRAAGSHGSGKAGSWFTSLFSSSQSTSAVSSPSESPSFSLSRNSSPSYGGQASVTPEPGTVVLLGVFAAGGVAVWAKRRWRGARESRG